MKKVLLLVMMMLKIVHPVFAQIVCTDFTITGTSISPYFTSQSPSCTISPIPNGNLLWTNSPGNGFPSGFIKHTFSAPQTDVSIYYTVVNDVDLATLSVNGGGVMTLTPGSSCITIAGTTIGYAGAGNYGDVLVNIHSTLPFTEVTLTNITGSGLVSGDCNSVIINSSPCLFTLGNDTSLCQGENLLLNPSILNATYVWQDGSTSPTYNVNQPGSFWVDVTVNGCTSSDTIHVNYKQLPIVSLGNDTTLCQGQSLTLNAFANNATYSWQDNSVSSSFNVTQQGLYWVQVASNNCIATDSIIVNYNPLPIFSLGNDTTLCIGDTLLLDVTTANSIYEWQDASSLPTFNVNQQGVYSVQVTANNCSVTDSIIVNFNAIPVVDLGNDTTLCNGQSILLNAANPNSSYLWQNNSTNSVFNVSQQGVYWVEVTSGNCSFIDTIRVDYNSLPQVSLGNDTTLCNGDVLLLNAGSGTATCLWQDNSIGSTFNVNQQGIYWVEVTQNNCVNVDSITVDFNPLPIFSLGNDTSLCVGQSLDLNVATANATYLWQNNSNNSNISVSQQGIYWVIVTVDNCSSSDSISVAFNSLPNAFIGNDTTICEGTSLVLNAATLNASYLWQNNSTSATLIVSQAGIYYVDLLVNKCSSSDTIVVSSENCEVIIDIPNVFSPNGDGINDLFTPITLKGVVSLETTIYNRWGKRVFDSVNPDINWTGGDNSEGTYFWIVKYVDFRNNQLIKKGILTLIK